MENAAKKIQSLLGEKLACYQQLQLVLKAEKKAIADIDIGMIWETTKAKKELAGKIEILRENILIACHNYLPRMDKNRDTFSLNDLVQTLPLPNEHKRDIRKLKRSINKEKDIVAHFIQSNQVQVKKHLAVMDNIMALIGNNGTQARYTGNGMVTRKKNNNCLFVAQV
nr:flagellar export chaperone FlgN [uncultured Desulfobacter sp.]